MLTVREQKREGVVTREELMKMDIVRPKDAGHQWQGIHHGDLAETIIAGLETRGINIVSENWHVAGQNAARLTGSLNLEIPNLAAPEGMAYSLGLHHGNDTCHALKFALGTQIFICSNGMVAGDFTLRRLHTSGFNLQNVVEDGLDQFMRQAPTIAPFIDDLKTRRFSENTSNYILMEAGRQHLLPWSRIGMVDKEYRNPSFPGLEPYTAWRLYNAFTYTVQKSPAQEQISAMSRFRDLVLGADASLN